MGLRVRDGGRGRGVVEDPRRDLSDPAALWEAMTIAQRRQLLRDGFTVTIAPAPRRGSHTFDPTLVDVEPTW